MPRGQRKSLEENIQAKQELINALNIRIESEQRELEEMFEQKRRKELEAVSDIIEDAGLAPEEVTEVLQQYILRAAEQTHHNSILWFHRKDRTNRSFFLYRKCVPIRKNVPYGLRCE